MDDASRGLPVLRALIATAAATALLLAACAPQVARPPEATRHAPDGFPDADYRQLAAQGRPVFRIDPARSLVVIEVFRAGPLARLGHDHVVAAHDLEGYVAPDDGRCDLYVRLEDLVVDEPELRAEAKLDRYPSADDIAGTRRNMLKGLQTEQFPFALVHIERSSPNGEAPLRAAFSLHGTTRTEDVPVQMELAGDELSVAGRLALRQTDFGVKPLSLLGGALQVRDEMQLRFAIRARRVR